jgi:hypothetical protein
MHEEPIVEAVRSPIGRRKCGLAWYTRLTCTNASAAVASCSAVAGHALSANDFIVGYPFTQGTRVTATGTTAIYLNCTVTALTGTQTTGVTSTPPIG